MPRESSGDGPSPAPKDICLPCLSTERGRRWGEPRRFRSRYTLSTSPWCRVVLLVSSADDWNGVWERHRDYPQGNTLTACPEPPHTCARLGYSKESDSRKMWTLCHPFSLRQLSGKAASCRRGPCWTCPVLAQRCPHTLASLNPGCERGRSCQQLSTCPWCSMQGASRRNMPTSRA